MFLLFRVYALFQQEYVVNVVTKLFFFGVFVSNYWKIYPKGIFYHKTSFLYENFSGNQDSQIPWIYDLCQRLLGHHTYVASIFLEYHILPMLKLSFNICKKNWLYKFLVINMQMTYKDQLPFQKLCQEVFMDIKVD